MKRNQIIAIVVFAIIIGIVIGRSFNHSSDTRDTSATHATKKPLYWIDSMEPQIHYPSPGKSRMGMELTPVYPDSDQETNDQSIVRISSAVSNNLGVRTAPVIKGALARRIEAVAYIEPNENKISHIHPYADGWVKKLVVKVAGETVKKDQLLLQLYSPMLVNVQEEYLIALESGNRDLLDASYKRLLAFRISEQQIQQLKQTRNASQLVDIYAPQDGIIAQLNVREGMRVTPDTEMMSLVDLSTVWMIVQVFEKQANWVKIGEPAEAYVSAFPGKVWKGAVDFIYPQIDPTTRTLKVRFHFDNPKGLLKPNMYANIILLAQAKQNVLSIPLEALIRSHQGDHVIVALGDGHFQARSVVVGMESGDRIEILSGLNPGENVVISGQFLIDSEADLKAGMQRLETPKENNK